MDIKLYKMKVITGKEETAREWLDFLKSNIDNGIQTLKNEKAYLEAYFTTVESEVMYVYMFFAANDVNYSNETALKSENPLDQKHFEYMQNCIDLKAGEIMDCLFYLDNLEDVGK